MTDTYFLLLRHLADGTEDKEHLTLGPIVITMHELESLTPGEWFIVRRATPEEEDALGEQWYERHYGPFPSEFAGNH